MCSCVLGEGVWGVILAKHAHNWLSAFHKISLFFLVRFILVLMDN